jgi:SpoVK/Ycf46/Vps4 family AAA+-type ATPase
MTAALLGSVTALPVYRIDLSKVVSKYMGETEKNLASLFDHAEHHHWILFFDEADSLFAKRTESRNAKDWAANRHLVPACSASKIFREWRFWQSTPKARSTRRSPAGTNQWWLFRCRVTNRALSCGWTTSRTSLTG